MPTDTRAMTTFVNGWHWPVGRMRKDPIESRTAQPLLTRTATMDRAEYERIVEYLRLAEQSKYQYEDIRARFEAEPATTYGANMANWIPGFEYAHPLLLESVG